MARIGDSVFNGLTEEEACILEDISVEDFNRFIEANPTLQNFIAKKKIEFKRKNLGTINSKRDPKNSMWMLERLMPEQFGSKKAAVDNSPHTLKLFITQIQKNPQEIITRNQKIIDAEIEESPLTIEGSLS